MTLLPHPFASFTSRALPPQGRVDLHSHLLPGIDDGCRDVTESLACIRELIKLGYAASVCTPHIWSRLFPDNIPAEIQPRVEQLQQAVDAAGLDYLLLPGGEVRLVEDTLDWLALHGVPTLGGGRTVLVDYWGDDWPDFAEQTLYALCDAGFQPVLAHPERMGLVDDELDPALDRLLAAGVCLQGNLNSISGGEGTLAQQRAQRHLAAGRYQLIASDTHRPDSIPGRARGLTQLAQWVEPGAALELLETAPRRFLASQGVNRAAG